jgi:putative transposase
MPRANRHFLPGHVWHITHRCHQQKFLLKFARDRRRYLHWVFEAKKRFGLSVLNYTVTSNHIHLLVKDTGPEVIAQSMQLIAGRTAQEYNQRKTRGERSGKTDIMRRLLRPMSTCIGVWCTLI